MWSQSKDAYLGCEQLNTLERLRKQDCSSLFPAPAKRRRPRELDAKGLSEMPSSLNAWSLGTMLLILTIGSAWQVAAQMNIPYAEMDGVDANLLSLDVHAPDDAEGLPVMIFVHGGAWQSGDKANATSQAKAYNREGYVFVSVNYRLAPNAAFPAWPEDVASAIAWVHENISNYGGDPGKLCLMGHSAGAHLVALVATDERYLAAHELELNDIAAVAVLDTLAYDLPALAKRRGGKLSRLYRVAFTDDPQLWVAASPITHVEPDKDIPPMILCYSGGMNSNRLGPGRAEPAEAFAAALNQAGTTAVVVGAVEKTHAEINRQFGVDGDHVAEAVFAFLREALER